MYHTDYRLRCSSYILTQEKLFASKSYTFCYLLEGNLQVEGFLEQKIVNPHQMFILNARERYRLKPENEHALLLTMTSPYPGSSCYPLLLEGYDQEQVRLDFLNMYTSHLQKKYSEFEYNLNSFLKKLYSSDSFYYHKMLSDNTYGVVTNIIDDLEKRKESLSEMSLAHYAIEANLNYYYLSKVFKEQTGYTFTEVMRLQRLFLASNTLINSQNSITEVAFQSGYSDLKGMHRDFKLVYGFSPKKYREKYAYLKHKTEENYLMQAIKDDIHKIKAKSQKRYESVRKHYVINTKNSDEVSKLSSYASMIDMNDYLNIEETYIGNEDIVLYVRPYRGSLYLYGSEVSLEPISIDLLRNIHFEKNIKVYLFFEIDLPSVLMPEYPLKYLIWLKKMMQKGLLIFGKDFFKNVSFVFSLKGVSLANISISEQGIFYDLFKGFIGTIRELLGFKIKIGFDAGILYQRQHELQRWKHSLQFFLKEEDMEVFFRIVFDYGDQWYPNEKKTLDFLVLLSKILPTHYNYGFSFLIKRKAGMDKPSYVHQVALNLYFLTVMIKLPSHFKMRNWMVESEQGFYINSMSGPQGLIDTSYFFRCFLHSLYQTTFFKENGCITSCEGNDLNCLLYSDYQNIPFDLSREDFVSQKKEKIFLELNNIEGTYRISEYVLDFNNFIDVYEMLFHLKHPGIRDFEKKMLQARLLPELKIYEKKLSGQFLYERKLGSIELVLLKFEKIS